MSAKKPSFDLTRKPVRAVRAPKKTSTPRPKASLRERRQAARSLARSGMFLLLALAVGAVIYGFWRPEVRITEVTAENVPDATATVSLIQEKISGTYLNIFPRNSVFFYPEKEVRAALLEAYPSLAAVSVSRGSFTSLSVEGSRRSAAFYWCGESAAAFSVSGAACYEADTEGLVFAHADTFTAETASSTMLRIYAPLENTNTASYPVRGMVVGADHLPNLLRFVKAVKTLGVPVLSTSIVGDEAELFVTPQTRIKYVLGREEEAAKNAQAALPTLNLLNGSVEYVDLRFDGKVYVKRYGE